MGELDQRKKVTVMIAIMATMLFASINQTIVGTALPRIISKLGGMDYYTWVFTIYMLTSSITAILVGKLSDMFGRKPFIIAGILIFSLGSFLSGLSSTIVHLIVFRGIQGFGGGMIMSTAFTAIGDLYAPRERARWQGYMTALFGLSSAFGPTLGGYIVDHLEWHWVFWIFLPFGLVALALIWLLFPSVEQENRNPIDYFGSLFLTLTVVPLLLAFSWAGKEYAWTSPQISGLFASAVLALTAFILIESKVKNPVIPLTLFKNSVFVISNLASLTMGAGMFGAIMFMPFFVQGVLGTSATSSGLVTMPMTFSLMIGSALSGQLIARTGKYKKLALGGLFVIVVGMVAMSFMSANASIPFAIVTIVVVGFGIGIGMPVFTLTIQNAVDHSVLGTATASSQLFRSLGGTIGVSVMGTVLTQRMATEMSAVAGKVGEAIPTGGTVPPAGDAGNAGGTAPLDSEPQVMDQLQALQDPQTLLDPDKLTEIEHALPPPLQDAFASIVTVVREALGSALSSVFLTGALIVAVAFVVTLFLKEIPLKSAQKRNTAQTSKVNQPS
ncbi:MDR family MFS transporter [Numidum massiliense]|uniref:MDR family MFS transporter n=1 Tax=Numidum massiliense TaxID=1522315 RepID=UPI0006D53E80|nr:MDR family MFS transporter [Numidum massiliense]